MRALTSYIKLGKNKHDDAPDAVTGLAEIMRYQFTPPKPEPVNREYQFIFGESEESFSIW
jgi:hypothetical protein